MPNDNILNKSNVDISQDEIEGEPSERVLIDDVPMLPDTNEVIPETNEVMPQVTPNDVLMLSLVVGLGSVLQ